MLSCKVDKNTCVWFKKKIGIKNGCYTMTELQCEKNGKCSFYETPDEYESRQANFMEKYEVSQDMLII